MKSSPATRRNAEAGVCNALQNKRVATGIHSAELIGRVSHAARSSTRMESEHCVRGSDATRGVHARTAVRSALQDKGAAPSIQRAELRLCVVKPAAAGISPEAQRLKVTRSALWMHTELRIGHALQDKCPATGY